MRKLALIALLLLATTATAQRRRTVARPEPPDVPAQWLAQNAWPLTGTEPTAENQDLAPLRLLVGDATTVGLGDATHGTHEFMTVKLRLIQYLVRELGFEAVGLEAPFATFNRLNEYVVHGTGKPRDLLARAGRLGYSFWDTEEFLQVVEWLRAYNAGRGDRPPVEVFGFDSFEEAAAASNLIAYLTPLDSTAAQEATRIYGTCQAQHPVSSDCTTRMRRIHDQLAARRADLVPRTSARAFDDALQNARIAGSVFDHNLGAADTKHLRDRIMSINVRWAKNHRGTNRKVVLWGHQEHIGRSVVQLDGSIPMGQTLSEALGNDYVAIGTCSLNGSFEQYLWSQQQKAFTRVVHPFRPATDDSYETYFRTAGKPVLLIPMRGTLPEWLRGPRPLRVASTYPSAQGADWVVIEALPEKLDATIYIEETTPLRRLDHTPASRTRPRSEW